MSSLKAIFNMEYNSSKKIKPIKIIGHLKEKPPKFPLLQTFSLYAISVKCRIYKYLF